MLFKLFRKSREPIWFKQIDPRHLKEFFIRGSNYFLGDAFHGKIAVQNIHSKVSGICYRKFDYYRPADLKVEEIPDCIRIEYLFRGAAKIQNPGTEPRHLKIGNYIITKNRQYVFQSCEKQGAEILVFYLPLLEDSVPDAESLATDTIYYSSPSMSELIHKLFTHDYLGAHMYVFYNTSLQSLLMAHMDGLLMDSKVSRYYHEIKKLEQIISFNLQKHYTIEELARMVGVNPTTIQREFRIFNKMTIHQFLSAYRIELAKKYLLHTVKDLKEIATLCGYCSVCHFGNDFKKAIGVTPKVWRQQNFGNYGTDNL